MSAFDDASDVLFENEDVAFDAVYTPQGGSGTSVRAIRAQMADQITAAGGGLTVVSTGDVFEVRRSEVPEAAVGDTLTIEAPAADAGVYTVQSEPQLIRDAGTWRLDTVKAT